MTVSKPGDTDARGGKGVLVVDVQGDFTELKTGSLAVPGADARYLDSVKRAVQALWQEGLPVYATQDWHPADHVSFYTNHPGAKPFEVLDLKGRSQILWPPHCVQGSPGAEILIPDIWIKKMVRKGMDPEYDSYSGFADDGGRKTELDEVLRNDRIREVVLFGLTTDYCVKFTAVDAINLGYSVEVRLDLCRGVAPDTTEAAIREMKEKGAVLRGGL
ncbi:MAG: bifunctional nicotinamidase/pyrazinamidase [Deltaproteobacteria bacterium]|nr:bifunctional nicotinamidase/pyrazinamidase [Deltaproteobacteria bacterium]